MSTNGCYDLQSGILHGSFGQHGRDSAFLHLDLDLGGDLDGDEMIANLAHAPQQPPGGHHLIPLAQSLQHLFVILRLFALWTDDHEIKDGEEDHHHDQERGSASALRGGALGLGLADEEFEHYLSPEISKRRIMTQTRLKALVLRESPPRTPADSPPRWRPADPASARRNNGDCGSCSSAPPGSRRCDPGDADRHGCSCGRCNTRSPPPGAAGCRDAPP